ncbi:lysophospholipid acyltransferase family protein [Roseobacteraceae bacterium S113]
MLRGLIGGLNRLPIRARLNTMSWVMRWILAGPTGYRSRARANLAYIWPDKPVSERNAIAEAALDNAARTIIENYDVAGLLDRMSNTEPEGPGLQAIQQARDAGQPVLLMTAHFGNFEAPRACLVARGARIGGLYRPMSNPFFNAHYEKNMSTLSDPTFAQGGKGTAKFIRHLKSGGMMVLLFDVYDSAGVPIDFLGQPAPTLTSAADIALRTGALMVPFFGIRESDGLTCRAIFEEPIPHGDPLDMTRALSERLEARIHAHPGQWFWVHRRWKPARQARRQRKAEAPRIAP